jgi:hypothetical protein
MHFNSLHNNGTTSLRWCFRAFRALARVLNLEALVTLEFYIRVLVLLVETR